MSYRVQEWTASYNGELVFVTGEVVDCPWGSEIDVTKVETTDGVNITAVVDDRDIERFVEAI